MDDTASPGWVEHVMWWHVYPLGFLGADATGADRGCRRSLAGLLPWLDYVIELGLNGILLGPIFESETHGYDTTDYYRIDSRLGIETDFRLLLSAARERGIRVLLDGVFNHVGRTFSTPEFLAADRDEILRRTDAGRAVSFEGHDRLVTLNHDDDRVVELVVDVMTYWLDRGIDGWRLDAAYAVPPAFWSRVLARVRATHPDAYFIGEYIHGDYPAVVREEHLDSVTQYELWQGIWHSIEDHNLLELDWALSRHNQFLQAFVPYTFIGNHDVTRIASQIGDPRHRAHALVLLMTLGGTPAIYYGDERGLTGHKEARAGGDDAIRPAYPNSPTALSDHSGEVYSLHRDLIGFRRQHPWLVQATSSALTLTRTHYTIEVRSGSSCIYVVLNIGEGHCDARVPAETILAGHAIQENGQYRVEGHGWAVLA